MGEEYRNFIKSVVALQGYAGQASHCAYSIKFSTLETGRARRSPLWANSKPAHSSLAIECFEVSLSYEGQSSVIPFKLLAKPIHPTLSEVISTKLSKLWGTQS